jgi:heat shock protein HslJ
MVEIAATETAVPLEDDEVESGNDSEESTGSPDPELTAVIVGGESAGAGKPFTVDGTQSEPGASEIVHYQWNMGDGTTLFGVSVQHAYEEVGLYSVTLTVVDREGNTDVTAQVVEIVELAEEVPEEEEAFTLVGTWWAMDYPLRGTSLTLEFAEDDLSGSAGCNTYSASYTAAVSENVASDIIVSGVTVTSSNLCTPEIMHQESGYLESLDSASVITVEGEKLTLETDSGTLTFSQIEASG